MDIGQIRIKSPTDFTAFVRVDRATQNTRRGE